MSSKCNFSLAHKNLNTAQHANCTLSKINKIKNRKCGKYQKSTSFKLKHEHKQNVMRLLFLFVPSIFTSIIHSTIFYAIVKASVFRNTHNMHINRHPYRMVTPAVLQHTLTHSSSSSITPKMLNKCNVIRQ